MAADCKSAALWSYGGSNPPLCTRVWKVFEADEVLTVSVQSQDNARNPAADRSRMWMALGALAVLAVLAWFTLDGNAVLPVKEYSFGSVSFGGFGMKVRWIPELILGLFALRVVTANMRARLEDKDRK
jgi:hypothetical protein